MFVRVLALGATLALGLTVPAQAKVDDTDTFRAGRTAALQTLKQTGASSVSVALLSGGRVVWSQGFGKITAAGRTPTASTRYGIGSVSKMVTALAVMQLVDKRKISLDAPVVRYLPDFTMASPQYRQITVRMLLNHSAGLPGSDYANGWTYTPFPGYAAQVLSGLRHARLKTTPGAMNVYCNDCFTLAGEVVARVSGVSFEQYVQTNIFDALGMTRSGFSGIVGKPVAPVFEKGKVAPEQFTNVHASGGVISTARDMLRLARVFTGERADVLSPSGVAAMGMDQTTTTLKAGPPSNWRYGLGWDDVRNPALADVGVTSWVKGGDCPQQHAGFVVAPDEDLAVVALAAGDQIGSSALETIANTVLLSALNRHPRRITAVPKRAQPSRAALRRMTGTYLGGLGNWRVVVGKGRYLRLKGLNDGAWEFHDGRYVLRRGGAFWSTANPGSSLRVTKAWGRTYLLLRSLGGTGTYYSSMALAQRVRPDVTLAQWRARAGQKWLVRNEVPSSVNWTLPWLRTDTIPGLAGYMVASGMNGTTSFQASADPSIGAMFLQVPLMAGRDLFDFEVTGDQLRYGSTILQNETAVPSLAAGPVTIGAPGYAEWFRAPRDMTVTLAGQTNWKTFDASLDPVADGGPGATSVTVTAGGYLVLFGDPATVVRVA